MEPTFAEMLVKNPAGLSFSNRCECLAISIVGSVLVSMFLKKLAELARLIDFSGCSPSPCRKPAALMMPSSRSRFLNVLLTACSSARSTCLVVILLEVMSGHRDRQVRVTDATLSSAANSLASAIPIVLPVMSRCFFSLSSWPCYQKSLCYMEACCPQIASCRLSFLKRHFSVSNASPRAPL